MTQDLTYTHTVAQADKVENTYFLVLYWSSNISSPDRFVVWTLHDAYADGKSWVINEGMSWLVGTFDYSFEIIGYETSERNLVEHGLSNLDDIKEL
ncbi:unnamed protein product, partial [marine sediment metagenome]